VGDNRKVIVISKHPVFEEGLRRVLEESKGFALLGAVSSLEGAVLLVRETPPDVVIFDGEREGKSGTDLAELFRLEPNQVVTLSLKDSNMSVFSRRQISQATIEDLLDSIQRPQG
jgi:DNA-binding NarL/FixJ family response regulator